MFTDLISTEAFDDVFADVFRGFKESMNSSRFNFNDSFPPLNVAISADEQNFVLETALTSYKKEWLEVSIDGRAIIVKATVPEEKEDKKYFKQRIKATSFERKYTLPEGYDVEKAEVTYEDGLLSIVIPTAEEVNTFKKLEIR